MVDLAENWLFFFCTVLLRTWFPWTPQVLTLTEVWTLNTQWMMNLRIWWLFRGKVEKSLMNSLPTWMLSVGLVQPESNLCCESTNWLGGCVPVFGWHDLDVLPPTQPILLSFPSAGRKNFLAWLWNGQNDPNLCTRPPESPCRANLTAMEFHSIQAKFINGWYLISVPDCFGWLFLLPSSSDAINGIPLRWPDKKKPS